MNKELILKYKDEFDYWLKEGKLLATIEDEDSIGKWEEVTNNNNWNNPNRIYILNDEYTEFRKALAEGKTIQYLETETNSWQDCVTRIHPSRTFHNPASNYRIKPEEPQFKEGNWVIFKDNTKHKIIKINQLSYIFDNTLTCGIYTETVTTMKLWKPNLDDYILEKDQGLCKVTTSCVTNTIGTGFNCIPIFGNKSEFTTMLEYCEPFIGELPINLKSLTNEL